MMYKSQFPKKKKRPWFCGPGSQLCVQKMDVQVSSFAEIILQIRLDLLPYVIFLMPAGVTELTEADALYAMKHASLKQFLE